MNNIVVKSNNLVVSNETSNHKIHDNFSDLQISGIFQEQLETETINEESLPIVINEDGEEFFNFFYPVRYINSTIYHVATKPIFFQLKNNNLEVVIPEELQSQFVSGYVPEEYTSVDITMRIISNVIKMYRVEISRLRKKFDEYEAKLHENKDNSILIRLNDFEQTLYYYIDGLKSNLGVLKLAQNLTDTQNLETSISYLIQMADTSVSIITSTRETFSNVIGNDLNIVMKILTIITVCLAVPNIFFSFYGMNVPLPLQLFEWAYLFIIVISVTISALIYFRINKKN